MIDDVAQPIVEEDEGLSHAFSQPKFIAEYTEK